MGTVLRCVRADYLKAKRSMLNVIYIIVPLILALAFAGYFHISSWNRTLKISAFLEMYIGVEDKSRNPITCTYPLIEVNGNTRAKLPTASV